MIVATLGECRILYASSVVASAAAAATEAAAVAFALETLCPRSSRRARSRRPSACARAPTA